MFLVGLTGNYGMGKSTVLKMFQSLGAVTYDADQIVASLLREEAVIKKIRNLFGEGVLHSNGSLDKNKVAAIIFANDASRRALEDFLHPLVFEKINRLLRQTDSGSGIVVVETPLLFERQYEGEFQRTITVHTKQESALDRLQTKGVQRGDALQRIQSQLPIEDKISKSDFTINNDGTQEETELQVKNIYKKLLREGHHGDRHRSRSLKKTVS
jgi:dephospho-CoA kinase